MSLNKKITIVGAGAIGSFYGAMMAKAGYDVTLVARGEHLEALAESGRIKVKSRKLGDFEADITAASDVHDETDIAFITVKSQDTVKACSMLKGKLKKDGYVMSIQNGVENVDVLRQFFDESQVWGCAAFVGLWIDPPGTVNHSASGDLSAGAVSESAESGREIFEKIFSDSGIKYEITDDIKYIQWKKLIWNIAYNPLSALLESTCGRMRKDEDASKLMDEMVYEALEAAKVAGVTIEEKVWRELVAYRDALDYYKTSMLQDIERGKNPEIDGILGPVMRRLEEADRKAPYCESIYRALKYKFGGNFIYTPKLTVDMIVRNKDKVLLIERKNKPYGWALPGGFVDYGEKVEDAVVRELQEETGIVSADFHMLGVYSDPGRDSRFHTVSCVYYTDSEQKAVAADDAKNAVFYPLDALPDDIAFDHREILEDYKEKIHSK